ncbi:MAG: hypothetical protein ACLPZM_04210 [Thermoplasmata archaeon]
MTIFAPNYAPPPPELEPRRNRTWAILGHQIGAQSGVLNFVLLVFIFIVVIIPLVVTFYLAQFLPSGLIGSTGLSTFYAPIGEGVWFILLIILVSSAGAAVIARDTATKAMTMYLARPIEPIDYLAAKFGAVGFWVFLGGVLPGWISAIILLALGYVSLLIALQAVAGFLLVGLFSIAAFSGLSVLFSSLTSRSTLAGAGIFGTLLGAYIVMEVLSGISGKSSFLYASPANDVLAIAAGVFGVSGNPLNPWSAGAILVAVALGTFGFAYFRLLRTQVIAE